MSPTICIVTDHLNKICPNFDILNQIYGEKKNFALPYFYCSTLKNREQSGEESQPNLDINFLYGNLNPLKTGNIEQTETNNNLIERYVNDNVTQDIELEAIELEDIELDDIQLDDIHGEYEQNVVNDDSELSNHQEHVSRHHQSSARSPSAQHTPPPKTAIRKSPPAERISRFKTSLSSVMPSINAFKENVDRPASNAASIISKALIERANALVEKNKNEAKWKEDELHFNREKFEFEKEMRLREVEFSEKIQLEKMKSEERLAELKIRLEHERLSKK